MIREFRELIIQHHVAFHMKQCLSVITFYCSIFLTVCCMLGDRDHYFPSCLWLPLQQLSIKRHVCVNNFSRVDIGMTSQLRVRTHNQYSDVPQRLLDNKI